MKHTKTLALALALVLTLTLAQPLGAQAAAPTFTDVPSTHKNYTAIEFCADNAFLRGRGGGVFDPDGSLSRGELVTVWGRTFHVRAHNFDDATKTHGEVDNAIVVLQGMGFFNGVSATHFDIRGTVSREQVARLVLNTYLPGVASATGADVYTDKASISGWALEAVAACTDYGIFDNVVSGGVFKPQQPITRAELSQVIYNLMEVAPPVWYKVSIDPLITGGAVTADKSKAKAGDTVTITLTADPGMTLTPGSLTVNGTPIYATTFTMPTNDVVISAAFQPLASPSPSPSPSPAKYTITIDPMITGGTVTADVSSAAAGDTVTLTVTPDPGMAFVDNTLTVNGMILSTVIFTMPAANVVVSAEFEPTV